MVFDPGAHHTVRELLCSAKKNAFSIETFYEAGSAKRKAIMGLLVFGIRPFARGP
jgi:hypothetical protein